MRNESRKYQEIDIALSNFLKTHVGFFLTITRSYNAIINSKSFFTSIVNQNPFVTERQQRKESQNNIAAFLSDSNKIQTHDHLVCKRTLSHLAKLASLTKWLSVHLQIKWLRVLISLLSLRLQIWRLLRVRISLIFR